MKAIMYLILLFSSSHLSLLAGLALVGTCTVVPLMVIFWAWALCAVGKESDLRVMR